MCYGHIRVEMWVMRSYMRKLWQIFDCLSLFFVFHSCRAHCPVGGWQLTNARACFAAVHLYVFASYYRLHSKYKVYFEVNVNFYNGCTLDSKLCTSFSVTSTISVTVLVHIFNWHFTWNVKKVTPNFCCSLSLQSSHSVCQAWSYRHISTTIDS